MTRDEVIEKIKKLLRMKHGGTPAEVETALSMAAELARKHGIDLSGVDPDKTEEQPIGHIDATTSARLGWECKYSSLVCQQFFGVTAMITQDVQCRFSGCGRRGRSEFKIRLIGTAWDTQIAIYVYQFLLRQFRVCWNTKRGRARNRQAFMYGMYIGICTKLEEQKQRQVSGEGLVLVGRAVARRDQYLKDHWPNAGTSDTTPDSDAKVSKYAGFLAGQDTEIRTGLADSGKVAPMLGA